MKVEIELPEIAGYRYTGEWRRANNNEPFIMDGIVHYRISGTSGDYLILKKIAPEYKTTKENVRAPAGVLGNYAINYVEIKALEDALSLVAHALKDTDDYKALARLIK